MMGVTAGVNWADGSDLGRLVAGGTVDAGLVALAISRSGVEKEHCNSRFTQFWHMGPLSSH